MTIHHHAERSEAAKNVTQQIHRESEATGTSEDPLGTAGTRVIARQIADILQDPKCHPSIILKVARAAAERRISPHELGEVLDSVISARTSRTLRSPGAYFVTCVKRIFQRNEIPW